MGKKKLIKCPHCENEGFTQNMAEVLDSGMIGIQRFHHKEYGKDYTVVGGKNFFLICGRCGKKVYVKTDLCNSGS